MQLGIPACLVLPALGTFCGALLLRYKQKGILGALGFVDARRARHSEPDGCGG